MIDVVGVPHGLKNLIRKAQSHDVLHRFFAQIMVNAEDRGLGEDGVDNLIELAGRLLIVAERLLNDYSAPRVLDGVGHAHPLQLVADIGEEFRGNRKVVCPVAAGAALAI